MKQKKNRYIVEAVKKVIKVRDLKPSKDAKGGAPPGPCKPGDHNPGGHNPNPNLFYTGN